MAWQSRCRSCGAWNSYVEVVGGIFESPKPKRLNRFAGLKAKIESSEVLEDDDDVQDEEEYEDDEDDDGDGTLRLGEIEEKELVRICTGIEPLDRVLGGGAVVGTTILIGGEPGVGKSTLLTEAIASFTNKKIKTLYGLSEESHTQLKWRVNRLNLFKKNKSISRNLFAHHGHNLEKFLDVIEDIRPQCIVADSIQMYESKEIDGRAGSVKQAIYCAKQLVKLNESLGGILFLVCHLTKDGKFAGPKSLEHLVDCNLMFENVMLGDPPRVTGTVCLSAPMKNRYGNKLERGFFKMTETGLTVGQDPREVVAVEEVRYRKRLTASKRQIALDE